MPYVIGIDSSTTATKAVLIDATGAVAGIGVAEYDYEVPQPGWSEQDPRLWWDGSISAIRSVLATSGVSGDDVVAIGLTGQMHGLVLLDAAGEVLRPAILWNDQRTARACDEIRAAVGPERLIEVTGNDALTGFTAPKLVWVRDHEPEVWARVAHVLLPKDYVRYRLTGDLALDKADGAGTLLFDLAARDWSPEVVGARHRSGVDAADPRRTGDHRRRERGGGRGHGAPRRDPGRGRRWRPGGERRGRGCRGAGRRGAVTRHVGRRVCDDRARRARSGGTGPRLLPCRARAMAPDDRDALGGRQPALVSRCVRAGEGFGALIAAAAEAAAGTDGLFFLPYLTGERSPHPDPLARGAFVGLTVGHDRRHLTRAVLEGVAFGLRDGLDQMVAAGMPAPTQVRASGGGTASPLWRQILADVLDVELATVSDQRGRGVRRGRARLGRRGLVPDGGRGGRGP